MIIGNSSYSIRDYIKSDEIPLEKFAGFCADIGIKALEYNDMFMESWDDDYLAKVKKSAADAGCSIACLCCGGNFCSDAEAERKAQVELISERIGAAQKLGAPCMRINVGKTDSEEKDATVGVDRVIEAFNALLPAAKEANVKMTIENHGGVSKKADYIVKIILNTDPEWVGSCPDFGNFHGDDRYRELAKVFPFAHHIHAKTHEFDENGEDTDKDYGRIMRMLKDMDNEAVLSIEFEGKGDQIEGVKKSKALIERYL